jgi:hypothetical protein
MTSAVSSIPMENRLTRPGQKAAAHRILDHDPSNLLVLHSIAYCNF